MKTFLTAKDAKKTFFGLIAGHLSSAKYLCDECSADPANQTNNLGVLGDLAVQTACLGALGVLAVHNDTVTQN